MTDRVFRGRKEVFLVDGESQFRPLPGPGPRRAYLHGDVVGEDPVRLCNGTGISDAFGRFLLAIHDPERRVLTLHNDRYGLVPCYWVATGERLHFSTRVRPLVARGIVSGEPDPTALGEALALQVPWGTRTLLAGVSCLEPGTELSIDLDTLATTRTRRWDPASILRQERLAFAEARGELLASFLEANRRCTEDADRVAVTLSGGMDTRCLLAAVLHLGRPVVGYHVAVPGSRAERYTRRIAELCQVPLHVNLLDAGFPERYHGLLRRIVEATEGMKLVPQPEMLWLRDQVELPAVVLHGAFGELSKLRVLRDFRLDDAMLGAERAALAGLLWRRFAPRFDSNLRIFARDFRATLGEPPRLRLEQAIESFDPDLGAPEVMQLCYLQEFVKSASYGHWIWNQRVPTRFPFLEPRYVDLLLRLPAEARLEQEFQLHCLQQIAPRLYRLPDENTGARASAPRLWGELIRFSDRARGALFASPVAAAHGDLLTWVHRMEPTPEQILEGCGNDPIYDRANLGAMIQEVRRACSRSAPRRGLLLRRARRDALALQTFFMVDLWRRFLREARANPRDPGSVPRRANPIEASGSRTEDERRGAPPAGGPPDRSPIR